MVLGPGHASTKWACQPDLPSITTCARYAQTPSKQARRDIELVQTTNRGLDQRRPTLLAAAHLWPNSAAGGTTADDLRSRTDAHQF